MCGGPISGQNIKLKTIGIGQISLPNITDMVVKIKERRENINSGAKVLGYYEIKGIQNNS